MIRSLTVKRLAEILGLNKTSVMRYINKNAPDSKHGSKVNVDHPVIIAYAAKYNIDLSARFHKTATERRSKLAIHNAQLTNQQSDIANRKKQRAWE